MADVEIVAVFDKLPMVGGRLFAAVDRRVRAQGFATEADIKTNIVAMDLIETGAMLGTTRSRSVGRLTVEVGPSAESAEGHPYPVDQEFGNSRGVPAHGFVSLAAEKARAEFPRRFDGIERELV